MFTLTQIASWLNRFGYIQHMPPVVDINSLSAGIKVMQETYGLKPTGEPDNRTQKMMTLWRCGCPDVFPLREHIGGANSTLYKWKFKPSDNFTIWYWLNYDALSAGCDLPKAEIKAITRDCFDSWEATCPIRYMEIDNHRDADILMTAGGNGDNFDGPGNILAWAELPVEGILRRYGGRPMNLKMDPDEPWVGRLKARGIKYFNTKNHEIGHTNGLTHSKMNNALMAAVYSDEVALPQKNDDGQRMIWRYGEPVIQTPKPPATPDPTEPTSPVNPISRPQIRTIQIQLEGSSELHSYTVT